jgi:hypothetical protein
MLDKTGFRSQVENCNDLPQPGSNREYYSPVLIIESFLVSIWCWAKRFVRTEVTRHDEVLKKIFGWKQSPAQDVYNRYFYQVHTSNQPTAERPLLFMDIQFGTI